MSPFLEVWFLQLLQKTFGISLVRQHSDWTKKSFFTSGVKIKNVSAHPGKGKHIFRQPVTSDNFCLFVSDKYCLITEIQKTEIYVWISSHIMSLSEV